MSKTIVENKSSKCTIFGYVMFQIVSFNGVTMATLEAVLNATKRIASVFFKILTWQNRKQIIQIYIVLPLTNSIMPLAIKIVNN